MLLLKKVRWNLLRNLLGNVLIRINGKSFLCGLCLCLETGNECNAVFVLV